MDRAALDAYVWTDLRPTCEFPLDYDDEDDAEEQQGAGHLILGPPRPPRARRKPWRYRWLDDFRDEVLARLLALNAQRAQEERLAGIAAEAEAEPKKGGTKKRGERH